MKKINDVWIAEDQDAWDLEHTLRPIIGAGIKRFIEDDKDGCPLAMLIEAGCTDVANNTEEESEKAQQLWVEILSKIDYAFNAKEPDIDQYDFNAVFGHGITEDGLRSTNIKVRNQEELDRYNEDLKEYETRKQEGYELFGKYLVNLWS